MTGSTQHHAPSANVPTTTPGPTWRDDFQIHRPIRTANPKAMSRAGPGSTTFPDPPSTLEVNLSIPPMWTMTGSLTPR